MRNKTKKLTVCTAIFAACLTAGAFSVVDLNAAADTAPTINIVNGAYMRVVTTKDGEEFSAKNGLRFSVYMDADAYSALQSSNVYTNVKYGVLIAPNTSAYTLTEETVFGSGEDKLYDWAVWSNGAWVYTPEKEEDGETNKYTRIMNFESNELFDARPLAGEDADNMYYRASITGVKEANLANEFQGIGYVSYTYNGTTYYEFTSKVVRSTAYVAQKAIADESANAPSDEVKTWLQNNYVNKATNVETTYSTEHYFEQKDGTFKVDESKTVLNSVTIDDAATPAPAIDVAGYVYDESNAKNELSGTKALANNKLVYKRYYLMTDVGVLDVNKQEDLQAVRKLDGYTATVNYTLGEKTTAVENPSFDANGVLDISGFDGTYSLVLTKGDEVITRTFDVYDSTELPVWNDTTSVDNIWGYRTTAGDSKTESYRTKVDLMLDTEEVAETDHNGTYYYVGSRGVADNGVYGAPVALNILPKHSKAYYELFSSHILNYEYYNTHSYQTALSFESTLTNHSAGWHTASVSVQTLIDNWDYITDVETAQGAGYSMFTVTITWGKAEYYLYLGNFAMDIEAIESTDEMQLIDVKGMDTLNVADVVDKDDYKVLASAQSAWKLTAVHTNEEYALTGGVVDFAKVPYGAYTLTATTANGNEVYTLNVDLYDSSAPEYNTQVSIDYVWGFRPTVANSVASETTRAKNTVEIVDVTDVGHKGKYYATMGTSASAWLGTVVGYNVKAMHSKEYYALYSDYSVTFEYYLGDTKDNYAIHTATAFANDIYTNATYGGDVFVGWYKAVIPVSTLLEKWDVVNEVNVSGVTGYANTMLSQNLSNSNNYTYFGNFKLEKLEVPPTTPAFTPAYNVVSDAVKQEYVWGLRSNSLTDGYYHSKGQHRLNVVEFSEDDALLGKNSGKYYSFDGTIAVGNSTYYLGTAPYYAKSVYEDYYADNPNAVMTFEFCAVQEGYDNPIRRAWLKLNQANHNAYFTQYMQVNQWYTITVSLKDIIDNYDGLCTPGSTSAYLIAFEAFDNRYTANGTQDTTLTAKQPTKAMMYFGNFQISANGTVGVTAQ